MVKKALVCVSFGTGAESGRADLQAVEAALQAAAPDRLFTRAWRQSGSTCNIAGPRRLHLSDCPRRWRRWRPAAWRMWRFSRRICSTAGNMIKSGAETARWQGCFTCLRLGETLLAGTEDLQRVAQALAEAWPPVPGEALILMGHGTPHFAGMAYAALQSAFALQGCRDVFVVVPRGWPTLEAILPALRQAGMARRIWYRCC